MPMYSPPGAPLPSVTWANRGSAAQIGARRRCSDVGPNPGMVIVANGTLWRPEQITPIWTGSALTGYINFGGSSATYTQTGTTVTVSQTSHGMTADFNGDYVYLTQSTGALVTGWFLNFIYIDANTFSCTSTVSQSTSGNLGTSTGEVVIPWSYALPTGLPQACDSVALQYLHSAKNSANNKTAKHYLGGLAIYSGSGVVLTTGGLVQQVSAGSQVLVSTSTFVTPAISSGPQALGNSTYTISSTLANASDWHRIVPQSVTFSARYDP